MMTPSGNTQAVHGNVTSQVGTGGPGTRFAGGDAGPPPAINVSLGGFLLLFVGSRLLYLVLIDPSYLCPQLGEQLYVGTVAQELLTGLKLPFIEYRRSNYMLGTLVMGGLASGFFRLFGPTLFALKLAPLFLFTFALGFVVGFAPWILFNVQTHFAGLVIHDKTVWEHFGLAYLWDGLSHPRRLSLYEFFADIASDDPRDLSRRAVNLLYSLLYLGPILTAGVLRLKTGESAPTRPSPPRPTLVGFSLLYVVVFALAVQFSDFRATRYHLPAYPFLFLFVALSLARCP